MIAFLRNYRLEIIKKKFIVLYLLNVTDIIFTVLLLSTGYFSEANFLMVKAVQNPVAAVLLKIMLPALLLFWIYRRMKDSDELQLRAANIAVNISISIYVFVNMTHILWTVLLTVMLVRYR